MMVRFQEGLPDRHEPVEQAMAGNQGILFEGGKSPLLPISIHRFSLQGELGRFALREAGGETPWPLGGAQDGNRHHI